MTKIQLSPNRLLHIRNDLGPFNISNLNYCYDIVKPFFNFICNNKSFNNWQLSIQSDQHICYQLYSKNKKLDLFSRIHKDLQPFKNRTILLKDIENISNSCLGCHHIQIIQNKLYIVPRSTVSNYETRSRSVKLLIKHMMDTFSDIPDLDLFFHVGDAVELPKELNDVLFNVPIFAFTKSNTTRRGLRPDALVLMPCFTLWGWPEVRAGRWSKVFQSILNASRQIEYEKRIPKLFWRGADTWKRTWYINTAKQYSNTTDIETMNWVRIIVGLSLSVSSTYTTLEQHCNYKHLLHLEGNTYSSRLKYLLLCGSSVVYDPIEHYEEYWYHLLENGKNVIFVERINNEIAFNKTLQFLQNHENVTKEIGKQGQQLVQNYLNEHAVSCYWRNLLHEYAKLFGYKPTLHPNAIYIDDFVLSNLP
ncbi:unnamed protein product [Adineta steineri]|uniref:Glycosyl transferase CAP10 domain-containing protein n=1 Tax=Adineta steineri TaxID=433720 RepID=A0A814HJH2_9BILA|nr:unnamed protein product [Adineta steineri]CAF4026339.1 unnamed protein product [Adineta steineri]